MNVLLAYDASDCSQVALADAARAGLPAGTTIHLVSVTEWFPLPTPEADLVTIPTGIPVTTPVRFSQVGEDAGSLAKEGAERLRGLRPDLTIETVALSGSPAQQIVTYADQIDADLVIVGSHGRSAIGRLLLGSISQQVLHGATSSVRIARGSADRSGSISLLIAVDGSNYTPRIVDAVVARDWPEGTTATVVTSADYSYDRSEQTAGIARTTALHAQIVERLEAANIRATSRIDTEEVSPTRTLLAVAEQEQAETIFLGARGLTGFERFMLGSISSAVAMQADCSVEVVR